VNCVNSGKELVGGKKGADFEGLRGSTAMYVQY
jgi:hypothetical protein